MKQQDSARFLTNYEISDILQHIAAVVNSNPQKNDYLNNGETYTAVEGHTIGFIKDHPGCTATEIACEWGKTTSAVSQLLKKLRHRGVVYALRDEKDAKRYALYLTEKEEAVDAAHRAYDSEKYQSMIDLLLEHYSREEMDATFRIMRDWYRLSMEDKMNHRD